MNKSRLLLLTISLFLSWAVVSLAGPLDLKQVPADTKWIGHVNVEAIVALPMVKKGLQECPDHEKHKAKLARLADKTDIHLLEDLQSVTVFDDEYGKHNGVLLVRLRQINREKLLTALKEKHPDYEQTEYADRHLYTFTAHKQHKVTGCIADEHTIVFGRSPRRVTAVLDVMDGKKPSLDQNSPLAKRLLRGNVLAVVRAIDVEQEYMEKTRCPVLRHCTAATAKWREKDGKLVAAYTFETTSPKTAKNFQTVVDGIKAMVALRCGDEQAVHRMLGGLVTKTDGKVFKLRWKVAPEDLQAAIKKHMKHKAYWKHRHEKKYSKTPAHETDEK